MDLVATSETENKMKGALFLDVVIRKSSSILQLFTSKDEPLLVWGNSFLVLDLCFHIFNGIRWFYLQSNGLAGEGLYKDLHATSETKNKMKGALFLDVVVRKCSSILQLLTSKDEPLLVWGNSFFVLDLCLHIFNGIRWFHLQSNSFSGEGLDKDLHSSSETENKMKSALLLDVVIRKSSSILQLFTSKDESLLVWGNSFLVLDLCLHIFNGIRWFDLQSDSFAGEGLDKDLHSSSETENEMKSALLLNVVIRKSSSIL